MEQFNNRTIRNGGVILVDIIVALTLAMLLIVIMTASAADSRALFERAKERSALLNIYEENGGDISSRLYGNDRIQTDFNITSTSSNSSSSMIQFTQISMKQSSGSIVTDFAKVAGTPLCSINFSNGNDSTVSITPIMLPINPSLPLTDLEVRNGIAYVSADSSIASDPDFLIIDINNPNSPVILSSINTGPGIASIALAGKRIYTAVPSTIGQIHIIRLDGLDNLTLENKFKLTLPYATATPPLGSAIFFNDNKIYLGTEKWDGDEFNIIDVADPIQPVKLSGLEIGSKITDIFVRDGTAYITSAGQMQLIVTDVHDPVRSTIKDSFNPPGWSRQEGKTVSSFEDILNFGRTSGGFNIVNDHEVFAWASDSSTSPPVLIGPASVDIPGGVYGIIADRSNIYLATRQVDKELQVFSRDLVASTSKAYSLPIAPQMMTCDGDRLYILAHTAPVVYEIGVGD